MRGSNFSQLFSKLVFAQAKGAAAGSIHEFMQVIFAIRPAPGALPRFSCIISLDIIDKLNSAAFKVPFSHFILL
jgi:hypothetical protein